MRAAKSARARKNVYTSKIYGWHAAHVKKKQAAEEKNPSPIFYKIFTAFISRSGVFVRLRRAPSLSSAHPHPPAVLNAHNIDCIQPPSLMIPVEARGDTGHETDCRQ